MLPNSTHPNAINILVAEDEPAVREFIVRGLGSVGYNVVAVEDGEHALDQLALPDNQFDLLITDIVMPRMDGISLALTASRDHPDLKIIMISGYADARARAHNLEALINFILAKPFTLDELLGQVKVALSK